MKKGRIVISDKLHTWLKISAKKRGMKIESLAEKLINQGVEAEKFLNNNLPDKQI